MKCEICNKTIKESSYSCGILCKNDACFKEHFWLSIIREYIEDPDSFAIIDGKSYRIGLEEIPEALKGFYGAPYTIKYFNGKIIHTTNLWTNGTIPNKYRIVLKDNASFSSEV